MYDEESVDYLFPCGPSPAEYHLPRAPVLYCKDCGDMMGSRAHALKQKRCQPCAIAHNRAVAKKQNRVARANYCKWGGLEL